MFVAATAPVAEVATTAKAVPTAEAAEAEVAVRVGALEAVEAAERVQMAGRALASEAHDELANSSHAQLLQRNKMGAGEAEARDDAQVPGQAKAEADEESAEQDAGARVVQSQGADVDAAGAEANDKVDGKDECVELGGGAGTGPNEDPGKGENTGDGENEANEEAVTGSQKSLEAEGGRKDCQEVFNEVGDEGEGEEGESGKRGKEEARLPAPGLRRTCFVEVRAGEWEPEPVERQLARWADLLHRRELRVARAAAQGMPYTEWSPGEVVLPQFEVASILEEVENERSGEPAELAQWDAERSRATNYVEEVYGPGLAVAVFLGLGRWHPSLRDAAAACPRANAEAAPAKGGSAAAVAYFAAQARSDLGQAERNAYFALRLEGDWAAFQEMWRISRERIGSNRIQAPQLPEISNAAPDACHCDSCFNHWPEVRRLAPPNAWARLPDHTTLFVCSAGCGRFLCWKCRTVIGACARSPACRGELLPPFRAAVRFYPEDCERAVNWRKLADWVDVVTRLAGCGVLSDGTELVAPAESQADRIMAEWLTQRAASRRRAADNSLTEVGCRGSGHTNVPQFGHSPQASVAPETVSLEAAPSGTPPDSPERPPEHSRQLPLPTQQQQLPTQPPTSPPRMETPPWTPQRSEPGGRLQQQQQQQQQLVPQPLLPSQPTLPRPPAQEADAASPSSAYQGLEALLMRVMQSQADRVMPGGQEAAVSWIASSASVCRSAAPTAIVPPSDRRLLAAVTHADLHGPCLELEALAASGHGPDQKPGGGQRMDPAEPLPAELLPAELMLQAAAGRRAAS